MTRVSENTLLNNLGQFGIPRGYLSVGRGRTLFWSDTSSPILIDADKRKKPVRLNGHALWVTGAAMGVDTFVTWSAWDGYVGIWRLDGNAVVPCFQAHQEGVIGVCGLHDGRYISWGYDGVLRLWHSNGRLDREMIAAHFGPVTGARQLRDGHLVSWGIDGAIHIWHSNGEYDRVFDKRHAHPVSGLIQIEDDLMITWDEDGHLGTWHADGCASGDLKRVVSDMAGVVETGHGGAIAWGNEGFCYLFQNGRDVSHQPVINEPSLLGVIEQANTTLVTWARGGRLRLLTADGQEIKVLTGCMGDVRYVRRLIDRSLIAFGEKFADLYTEKLEMIDSFCIEHMMLGGASIASLIGVAIEDDEVFYDLSAGRHT